MIPTVGFNTRRQNFKCGDAHLMNLLSFVQKLWNKRLFYHLIFSLQGKKISFFQSFQFWDFHSSWTVLTSQASLTMWKFQTFQTFRMTFKAWRKFWISWLNDSYKEAYFFKHYYLICNPMKLCDPISMITFTKYLLYYIHKGRLL